MQKLQKLPRKKPSLIIELFKTNPNNKMKMSEINVTNNKIFNLLIQHRNFWL